MSELGNPSSPQHDPESLPSGCINGVAISRDNQPFTTEVDAEFLASRVVLVLN